MPQKLCIGSRLGPGIVVGITGAKKNTSRMTKTSIDRALLWLGSNFIPLLRVVEHWLNYLDYAAVSMF